VGFSRNFSAYFRSFSSRMSCFSRGGEMSWWDSSTGAATRLVKSPSLFLFPFCVAYLVYLSRFVTRRGSL